MNTGIMIPISASVNRHTGKVTVETADGTVEQVTQYVRTLNRVRRIVRRIKWIEESEEMNRKLEEIERQGRAGTEEAEAARQTIKKAARDQYFEILAEQRKNPADGRADVSGKDQN